MKRDRDQSKPKIFKPRVERFPRSTKGRQSSTQDVRPTWSNPKESLTIGAGNFQQHHNGSECTVRYPGWLVVRTKSVLEQVMCKTISGIECPNESEASVFEDG
uniref:AlNc14C60G4401 protein n=1 Tax=Albugo laibachii Nc14 TaxID=890382 RepID=F0WCL7_9STRA|nr:AlNc14C60G4401 [Albugo laibachii Nc14]|eukprot:CCA18938.1 AlNc14C60G4401 [Albugo laibachii Nc14]